MSEDIYIINDLREDYGTDFNIVILTGAGISAESGVPTFRASDGLWCGHRVEDVATPEAFLRNPAMVHDFYNERRQGLMSDDVTPNAAHKALGTLQDQWAGDVTIVTQSIDNLHERGGSKNVIHMHGEIFKSLCVFCLEKFAQKEDSSIESACPACSKTSGVRPDIVWFGEIPYHMDVIERRLSECDLFLSVGTSGNVYPAAGFVRLAGHFGAKTIEINLEPSLNAYEFSHGIYGKAGDVLPDLVSRLLG